MGDAGPTFISHLLRRYGRIVSTDTNDTTTQAEKAARFLALQQGPEPVLLPNPWDVGSARLLTHLGFKALASTSGGFAATLGRGDGKVTLDEKLAHLRRPSSRPSTSR